MINAEEQPHEFMVWMMTCAVVALVYNYNANGAQIHVPLGEQVQDDLSRAHQNLKNYID